MLRGSGFAFQQDGAAARGPATVAERLFGLSSLLTPFFLGTVVGAIAVGRVPVGNAAGDAVTSWLNPLSLLIGALFVATVRLPRGRVPRQRRPPRRRADLERYFTARALGAAVAAGVLAIAGLVVLHDDARYVYDGLTGDGLPLVIASALCGAARARPAPPRRAPGRRARWRSARSSPWSGAGASPSTPTCSRRC